MPIWPFDSLKCHLVAQQQNKGFLYNINRARSTLKSASHDAFSQSDTIDSHVRSRRARQSLEYNIEDIALTGRAQSNAFKSFALADRFEHPTLTDS